MKTATLVSAILIILSTDAMAETPSFNLVSVGYFTNLSGINYDGFGIGGSFEVTDDVFIAASYSSSDLDDDEFLGFDVDGDEFSIGMGVKTDISDNTVFYAKADYLRLTVKVSDSFISEKVTDSGFQFGSGIRSNLNDNIELSVGALYFDYGNGLNDVIAGAGIAYNFTELFGIYVGLTSDFDDATAVLGARLTF